MGSPKKTAKTCEPFAVGGNKVMAFGYFDGPVAYTTGGDELEASNFGLTYIVTAFISTADSGDRILRPIFAAGGKLAKKFKCLITDLAGTEVGNGSNQSAKKFRITVIGIY